MKLEAHETILTGQWVKEASGVRADAVSERINWLTSDHLHKIAVSPESGGWEVLFRDPEDGRYWERTYPQGEMHGGGPPMLKWMPLESVRIKYHVA